MSGSARIMRRHWRAWPTAARTAAAVIAAATLALLAACMRRQPVIGRLTKCRRFSELPISGRLLPLHALSRRASFPDPAQRRRDP